MLKLMMFELLLVLKLQRRWRKEKVLCFEVPLFATVLDEMPRQHNSDLTFCHHFLNIAH